MLAFFIIKKQKTSFDLESYCINFVYFFYQLSQKNWLIRILYQRWNRTSLWSKANIDRTSLWSKANINSFIT